MRGRRWKLRSLVNLMEEGPEGMKKSWTVEPAMNKKYRLVLTHKWKMSKKLSFGARILNVFRAFCLFCLWQAFLTKIPTFSSIQRVVSIHYDMRKSFGKLTAEGQEDSKDMRKKEQVVITCVGLAVARTRDTCLDGGSCTHIFLAIASLCLCEKCTRRGPYRRQYDDNVKMEDTSSHKGT